MSLSATLFGRDSFIHKATNVLGLGIPGWLDKQFGVPDAQGPALGEMAQQTSQEGTPRAIVWGVVRPIAGNLIAVQDPPKIRKIKQKQEGGKGGGSKSKTVYVDAAFRTYAIRICEGPVTGIRRVWRNNKLVYDNRTGSTWGAKNNRTFLAKARFYLGGWSQMPAPELQAIFGMGNVPAHRGTCYMTMNDEDLTEMGGAVPQYIFEVERAEGYYLTSMPYPVEDLQSLNAQSAAVDGPLNFPTETLGAGSAGIVGGSLRSPLINYDTGKPEGVDADSATIDGGQLIKMLISYGDGLPDSLNAQISTISGGSMEVKLIVYSNSKIDSTQANAATIQGGDLS